MADVIDLNGLDGANPLGFLAALGTLALCERLRLNPRLTWTPYASSYYPKLWLCPATQPADLAERVTTLLKNDLTGEPPAWCAGTVIKRLSAEYRRFAEIATVRAFGNDRYGADFAAAFASDAVTDEGSDEVTPTRFSFANGQSGKVLLRDYRDLATDLTPQHVEAALLQVWTNADACKTFRWDPCDLRLYALRAEDPAASTVFSTHGGNVIAFWGLTLLPSFPRGRGELISTSFARLPDGAGTSDFFTWPIWTAPLTPDVIRSTHSCSEWYQTTIDSRRLREMGVSAVFRSKRLSYQKSLFFTPSLPV